MQVTLQKDAGVTGAALTKNCCSPITLKLVHVLPFCQVELNTAGGEWYTDTLVASAVIRFWYRPNSSSTNSLPLLPVWRRNCRKSYTDQRPQRMWTKLSVRIGVVSHQLKHVVVLSNARQSNFPYHGWRASTEDIQDQLNCLSLMDNRCLLSSHNRKATFSVRLDTFYNQFKRFWELPRRVRFGWEKLLFRSGNGMLWYLRLKRYHIDVARRVHAARK